MDERPVECKARQGGRLPFAPLDSSTAAMEAHSPRQMVETSLTWMKFMASRMPKPAVTLPPGELM